MATPEQKRRVDMARLKAGLAGDGFGVVVDARIILIVRKGVESSIYDDGKVLLKTTDRALAETGYEAIRPHLEAAWR